MRNFLKCHDAKARKYNIINSENYFEGFKQFKQANIRVNTII